MSADVSGGTRRRLARTLAALAVVAAALAVAAVLADRRSGATLELPAGSEAEPELPLELVVDEPRGGRAPRGIVWVLCCGAWRSPATHGLDLDLPEDRRALGALEWTRRGYLAATFAVSGGSTAVEEAVAAYDRLREEHPGLPVCAIGSSAGGHMALMVAARRPELRCVAAHSAPTSLPDLPDDPIPGVLSVPPLSLAVDVFGRDRLEELSPIEHAERIRARVRLAACTEDRIVPPSHARRMAGALREGPSAGAVLRLIPGESVRRGERPPRGYRHLVHECFAAADRVEDDRADTIRFVRRTLAELRGQASESRASGS